MRYDEDESIKGDLDIMPRGAINLANKEQMNVRRIEFLTATANQIDMEIMGKDGRAAVLREVAKGLQMPVDELIPSKEKALFESRTQARLAMSQAKGATSTPTQPDGAPKGGAEGNVVSNKQTGAA
jgi:hypothetical protein